MPASIPVEVRKAAVAAYERGEGTVAEVAARFGMSAPSLQRFLRRARSGEPMGAKPRKTTDRRLLDDADREVLRELALENDQMKKAVLAAELAKRTGKSVSGITIGRELHAMGIRRVRPPKRPGLPAQRPTEGADRYRPAHRDRGPGTTYSTDLTDDEWAELESLFEAKGPGRPRLYPARVMLNAMFYVVRTGCAWRLLPDGFPPWQAVYATFRRWGASGKLDQSHDVLRRRWRQREGRSKDPSAIIVDSQSVPTTEKGGLEVTTRGRRSRVESAISP